MRWMTMAACASLVAGRAAAQVVPTDLPACGGIGAAPTSVDSAALASGTANRGAISSPADSAAAIIRIDARFTAESIRLNAPSSARVVLPSCAPGTGVRVERQNLPDRLEPGTTYRNGGIRIVIQADAALACRLAAALTAPAGTPAAAGLDEAVCGTAPASPPTSATSAPTAAPVPSSRSTPSAPATPPASPTTTP